MILANFNKLLGQNYPKQKQTVIPKWPLEISGAFKQNLDDDLHICQTQSPSAPPEVPLAWGCRCAQSREEVFGTLNNPLLPLFPPPQPVSVPKWRRPDPQCSGPSLARSWKVARGGRNQRGWANLPLFPHQHTSLYKPAPSFPTHPRGGNVTRLWGLCIFWVLLLWVCYITLNI